MGGKGVFSCSGAVPVRRLAKAAVPVRRLAKAAVPVRRLAKAAVATALVSASCLVGLALTEAALRLFFPLYDHLVEGRPDSHPTRIWANGENSFQQRQHPDTGLYHAFQHNNLALRHDRDFGAADFEATVNIGLFGDSFTENYLLPSLYSLSEPLDFLLNTSGDRFNVLNFGVSGYGPGQSFLHYEEFSRKLDLDYVFYLYHENDWLNLYQTRLFYLDAVGDLRRKEVVDSSWWVRFASRFHVTYALLDIRQQFDFRYRTVYDLLAEYSLWANDRAAHETFWLERDENLAAVFKALVGRWRRAVENADGRFRVVVLPSPAALWRVAEIGSEADVIDLHECFRGYDPAHGNSHEAWLQSPYRFQNDAHWNEAGNQLAAVCLYRYLEREADLPRLSDDGLREALYRYYTAFRDHREIGWMPGGWWAKAVPVSPTELAGIRRKYSPVFNYAALRPDGDTSETLDRVGVDVRIDGNRIVYTKASPCRMNPGEPFFLHVAPVDANDLAAERRGDGFDNIGFPDAFWYPEQNRCVGERGLPNYDIAHLRTGQFDSQTGDATWEADFFFSQQ